MKVKHTVVPDIEDVNALYDIIAIPAMVTYGSVAMQEAAMIPAKEQFHTKLTSLLAEAFIIGCNIGKAKADIKDTEMYHSPPT